MNKKVWILAGLLFAVYAFRYASFSETDSALEAVIDKTGAGKDLSFVVQVVDEPVLKNGFLTIKSKIQKTCEATTFSFSNVLDACQSIEARSFVLVKIYAKQLERVLISDSLTELKVGDEILIHGRLSDIQGSLKIKDSADAGYAKYLRKERVYFDLKNTAISSVERPRHFMLRRFLIDVRKSIESSIAVSIPVPESGLAQGLVISGKGSLSESVLEEFTRVGLIHIVVLSGSNVSIISAALFAALSFVPGVLKTLIGICAMSAFAIMTGASPPVVRSVLMTSLPMIMAAQVHRAREPEDSDVNHIEKHRFDPWYSPLSLFPERIMAVPLLLITASCMSIYDPLMPVLDVSFQLSFMATLGLMLLTRPISRSLTWVTERFGTREVVASSIATQVFVSPLLLNISDQLSTVFLIANLVVLPILPLVMFCIFCCSVLGFISEFLAIAAAGISYGLLVGIMKFVHWLASFEWSVIRLRTITGGEVLVAYAAIIGSILGMKFSSRKKSEEIGPV